MVKRDEVIFNTHQHVKKLMSTGIPEAQAEAQVEIFIQFIDANLATKLSLEQVASELKRDIKELDLKIESVEANLKRDIKELDYKIEQLKIDLSKDITIKMGAMAAITISILTAVIKFV